MHRATIDFADPLVLIETDSACEPDIALRAVFVPVDPQRSSPGFSLFKRVFDVAIAGFALAGLLPVFLLTAALIWLEDRGPILYKQSRVGMYGIPFWFYKFRSMRPDADRIKAQLLSQSDATGAAFKMRNDPRVTRVGRVIRKYSIDELPQLMSVFLGQMSVIGPRPHLSSEVDTYAPEHHQRLLVKPGLLCLREVTGRSNLTFDDWLRLDLEYVRRRSVALDLKIFVLAVPAILKGDGAY